MTQDERQALLDYIAGIVLDKAKTTPTVMKQHMRLFEWGFLAKIFGKDKRFEREVREIAAEFIDNMGKGGKEIPTLDAYLRAVGIDGYEIMMKVRKFRGAGA